jgi:hypothetical protein
MNEPDRTAWIVENWYGIEISGCTQNACRIKLARLLGSSEMENYLNCISIPWSNECRDAYFQAMRSLENGSFPKMYTEQTRWRNEIVNVVGQSLRALKTTGVDKVGNFNALWAPNDRAFYTAKFAGIKWARFVMDTVESCAFVTVTSSCLEFRDGQVRSMCRNRPPLKSPPVKPLPVKTSHIECVVVETRNATKRWEMGDTCPSPEELVEKASILETAILLNRDIVPNGLQLDSATKDRAVLSHDFSSFFDFGHTGRLRFHSRLKVVGNPVVIMQYQSGLANSGKTWVQQKGLKRNANYHGEARF